MPVWIRWWLQHLFLATSWHYFGSNCLNCFKAQICSIGRGAAELKDFCFLFSSKLIFVGFDPVFTWHRSQHAAIRNGRIGNSNTDSNTNSDYSRLHRKTECAPDVLRWMTCPPLCPCVISFKPRIRSVGFGYDETDLESLVKLTARPRAGSAVSGLRSATMSYWRVLPSDA